MKVRLSVFRVKKFLIGCAAAIAVLTTTHAEPSDVPFEPSKKFPKIQVRHVPAARTDKVRQLPAPRTPRTKLPVENAPGPKGGKLIHPDNTYLIQCPAPAAKATNAPAPTAKR